MKAFPQSEATMFIDLPTEWQQGMDLIDYFAAKAMPISFQIYKEFYFSVENYDKNKNSSFQMDDIYPALIARTAYELADAMMRERRERNK
jgi:hypothetical protein